MPFPGLFRTIKDGFLYLSSSIFLPLSISFIMAGRLPPGKLRVFGGNAGESSKKADEADGDYNPTPTEVIATSRLLVEATRLPLEVVVTILDFAEYWASSSTEIDYLAERGGPYMAVGSGNRENVFMLRTPPVGFISASAIKGPAETRFGTTTVIPYPLVKEHSPSFFANACRHPTPSLMTPVRKIVFWTRSRDQGWGGQISYKGSYKNSWTWFEAGLERFDANADTEGNIATCFQYTDEPVADCADGSQSMENAPIDPGESSKSPMQASPLNAQDLRPIYPSIVANPTGGERSSNSANSDDEVSQLQADETETPGERGVYTYEHPLNGTPRLVVQQNKLATRTYEDHTVTWASSDNIQPDSDEARQFLGLKGRGLASGDGSFVRELKLGDVVTIWAKARFPGWENRVEKVKMEVYWAM